jgi:hypothetical protein
MPYAPTVSVQPTAEAARLLVAVDDRVVNERRAGREDPTWIGTIRGGYGNPLKRLNSDAAFADGLVARGLRLPAGNSASPYRLAVTIHEFDANQYVRRSHRRFQRGAHRRRHGPRTGGDGAALPPHDA